jgi:hypothetical protein
MPWTFYNASGQRLSTAATIHPVFGRATRTAGGVTTTSTSLVDLTDASITFTTGAFPVAFAFGGQCAGTNANEDLYFNVIVDSTLQFGTSGINHVHPTVNGPHSCSFSGDTVALSAASHTLKVQWRVGAGTGTTYADSDTAWVFSAHEIR